MRWTLLDAASDAERTAVLSAARRRRFARGEVIFHEGDPGDTLHLVDKGHVAVRVSTPLGDLATQRIHGPGDFFGELAVVSPAPRNATLFALDAVETLSLHRDQIDELRDRHPQIDRVLLEATVAEVRRLSSQLLDALYLPVPKRIARRIVELAAKWPDGAEIPLTQGDIAELCGTTRSTANKILAKQEESGLITLRRGRLTILDLEGLRRSGR